MIDLLGWAGSFLLVVSLLQSRMMRLRILNLIAALALVAYNAVLFVWPMVGMNLAVAIIDVVQIARIRTSRDSSSDHEDGAQTAPHASHDTEGRR